MAFKWAYNTSYPCAKPKEFLIGGSTAIEKGEVVLFTPAVGIAAVAGTDFDDPAIGVAAESHDGSTADFLGRQTGTAIRVFDDAMDVFELEEKTTLALTGGSTTVATVAGLLPQTDNLWINGYIEIITCAADSDLIGRMVKITDSVGATGVLTLAETLPSALAAVDTIKLYPGNYALNQYGWDLNSDGTEPDYETSAGEAIQLVKVDAEKKKSYWKMRLHQKASGPAAL